MIGEVSGMKRQTEIITAKLVPETVDEFSGRIRSYLKEMKLSNRDIMRYAMSAEEILLKLLDGEYAGRDISLQTGVRFFRPYFSLHIRGEAHNLFLKKKEERSLLGEQILRNLGLAPEYSYTDGENIYFFRVKRREVNPFVSLLIAIAAAVFCGAIGQLLPVSVRQALLTNGLSPLHETFLNVLGCIAGPMIFLSVAWGIYGIGDAATLKRIGKQMLGGYIGTVYVILLLIGGLCVPLFSFTFAAGGGSGSEVSAIVQMLLGVIPKNIFSPFVDGNTLQIIFLAVVIGIAMLFLGQKTDAVAKAVEQINYIVQFLIEFISKLVPYFIFVVLLQMIWLNDIKIFISVGRFFIVFIGAVLLMAIGVVAVTSLQNRINPFLLIKKGLPTLLIAITTASSAAAFGTNMNACQKRYGINNAIASFGIPLGMVTFKPTTAVGYLVISLFFSETFGVTVSAPWFLMLFFVAGILALATPPIPGGAMTAYTVLFAQLGIPAEALAIALACDTLVDFIDTGFDQFLLPFALLNQAKRLGLVDEKVLREKN